MDLGIAILIFATFFLIVVGNFTRQQKQLQKEQYEHDIEIEELRYKHELELLKIKSSKKK